jgi:hypothetical protein
VEQPCADWVRCAVMTFWLLAYRRIHLPKRCVGLELHFADGTASKVYRETVVDRPATADPAVLVVGFQLRAVHGQPVHALFRFESLFNTPLFGFSRIRLQAVGSRTIPNDISTAESMNGTARRSPMTTYGPCGACWRSYAGQGQSTMKSCPASPERNC